jgi:hypothetical protein
MRRHFLRVAAGATATAAGSWRLTGQQDHPAACDATAAGLKAWRIVYEPTEREYYVEHVDEPWRRWKAPNTNNMGVHGIPHPPFISQVSLDPPPSNPPPPPPQSSATRIS